MKKSLSVLLTIILSSCATPPDSIKPMELPESAYMNRACDDLLKERTTLAERANATTNQQKKAADSDAMGMFLIGLPVTSMVGGDRGKELSMYRGQLVAVERAIKRKGC